MRELLFLKVGGRLAVSLMWWLVPSETDMRKLDRFLMVSAWRKATLFLPLTDLRFQPTLGAARILQMRSNWLQYGKKGSVCAAVCCNDQRLLGTAQVLHNRDQCRKE